VNPDTGDYSSSIPTPTGIPSDPALAGKGEAQARELAAHLVKLSPPIERFYSSPFYRCLQTLNPTLEQLPGTELLAENGIGEWYGTARFDHPSPASPSVLKTFFPRLNTEYEPVIRPSVNGESIEDLHDRSAYALHRIIEDCDRQGVRAIVLCTHAATLIALGRALTGRMPADVEEEDFRPFTCGLSRFVRRSVPEAKQVEMWKGPESAIPETGWRDGSGVGGGWDLVESGDCSFLSGGEERGWYVIIPCASSPSSRPFCRIIPRPLVYRLFIFPHPPSIMCSSLVSNLSQEIFRRRILQRSTCR
jgi:transcription factor C subunit 7